LVGQRFALRAGTPLVTFQVRHLHVAPRRFSGAWLEAIEPSDQAR
jgi:hypothetical protein